MAVGYVSKWVEALPCVAADSKSSKKMFQEIIFPRFGVLRVVISNGGSHFIDKTFKKCISKLGVGHRVATPYHPQTSGQAEIVGVYHQACSGIPLAVEFVGRDQLL